MDSLGNLHNKSLIARPVRRWLNKEWIARGHKPLATAKFRTNIFDVGSMPVIQPNVPFQTNGCDCGVFMCRYAYSLYVMRHMVFTKADIEDECRSRIDNSPSYNFGMDDIARLRRDMIQVITKLSPIYLERMKRKRLLRKRQREQKCDREGPEADSGHDGDTNEKDKTEIVDSDHDGDHDQDGSNNEFNWQNKESKDDIDTEHKMEESRQIIRNLQFSVQSESRTGEKERTFEVKAVSKFGKEPKCNLCSSKIEKGGIDNPSWNIVTGGKHFCFNCVKYFSRQERRRINSLVMIDEDIDEFTQNRFADIMRDCETIYSDTDING